MNKSILVLTFSILIFNPLKVNSQEQEFTIAFGSCNDQNKDNPFWKEILKQSPDVWVWGGDNIYADTHNMKKMKRMYLFQKQNPYYAQLIQKIPVLATWDDHDYGANDAGKEYTKKKESQQLFLDFIDVDKNSKRRKQEGIYHSKTFKNTSGSVKIILLDTRSFRSSLTKGSGKKRYQPNKNKGTLLGTKQWQWLENELQNSLADFNIIVSSIQVLSAEHQFEKWANFPNEIAKLFTIIENAKVKNIIILSGDRHISEFSIKRTQNLSYPIIDFTSSGLTHAYTSFKKEINSLRKGDVINTLSYGLIKLNFTKHQATFKMMGIGNTVLQEITQTYP